MIGLRPIEGDNAVNLHWPAYPDQVIHYQTPQQIQVATPPLRALPPRTHLRGPVVFLPLDRTTARWEQRPEDALRMELTTPGCYRVEVELVPSPDSVAVRATLENLSDWDWTDAYMNFCVRLLKVPIFFDETGDRTIVFFSDGPKTTTQTRRNLSDDPTAAGQYYLPAGRWMRTDNQGLHCVDHGGVCPDRVANGLVIRLGKDGESLLATCWRHVHHIWAGTAPERENCIHSDPYFGDLEQGQAVVREGHVYLMQTDLEEVALRAAKMDNVWIPGETARGENRNSSSRSGQEEAR
jgi:hypothetical protein